MNRISQTALDDIHESPAVVRNANYKAGGCRVVVEVSGRNETEIDNVMIEVRTLADHMEWLWDRRSSWQSILKGGLISQRFVWIVPKGKHGG